MPKYTYRCLVCDKIFDDWSTIDNRNNPVICECGGQANRDVESELNIGPQVKWITDNPRWSISMGVPASQVNEFRKRFPNSTYDNEGRLLIKNRSDKVRQMRERNFVELSGKEIGNG
jgi:putative FmdB family regulatory protein